MALSVQADSNDESAIGLIGALLTVIGHQPRRFPHRGPVGEPDPRGGLGDRRSCPRDPACRLRRDAAARRPEDAGRRSSLTGRHRGPAIGTPAEPTSCRRAHPGVFRGHMVRQTTRSVVGDDPRGVRRPGGSPHEPIAEHQRRARRSTARWFTTWTDRRAPVAHAALDGPVVHQVDRSSSTDGPRGARRPGGSPREPIAGLRWMRQPV